MSSLIPRLALGTAIVLAGLAVQPADGTAGGWRGHHGGHWNGHHHRHHFHHHRHHRHGGVHLGLSWVFGPSWYYRPAPVYRSPPRVVIVQPPPPPRHCREFRGDATVDHTGRPFYGIACLEADGAWHIVR